MTLDEVARAVGARHTTGDLGRAVGGFSIDSRTLAAGDLFVAIRGPRFDGHDFVDEALVRGACGAIVAVGRPGGTVTAESGDARIVVQDTLGALQALARHVRRSSGTRVVAITGSAGKTTTKEIAARVLAARYRVFKNVGNLNNEIGLPLSLLELRHRPDVAVVELGMNHTGEIRTLVGVAEPDVRVWTNVSEAHLGFFTSVEAIADAKAEILEQAGPEAVLVANANDARVMTRARRFAGRVCTFGIDVEAQIEATHVQDRGLDGTHAQVRIGDETLPVTVPLLGTVNLANALAAIAVGTCFDVPARAMVDVVGRLHAAAHRGEVVRMGRLTVIDDAYNSNPAALTAMLRSLGAMAADRRVAVIGEMLELGEASVQLHVTCGREAVAAGVDRLITIGGAPAVALGQEAVARGLPPSAVSHVDTSAEAATLVAAEARAGDLVLVKGSRGIRTEIVVDRLREAAS